MTTKAKATSDADDAALNFRRQAMVMLEMSIRLDSGNDASRLRRAKELAAEWSRFLRTMRRNERITYAKDMHETGDEYEKANHLPCGPGRRCNPQRGRHSGNSGSHRA